MKEEECRESTFMGGDSEILNPDALPKRLVGERMLLSDVSTLASLTYDSQYTANNHKSSVDVLVLKDPLGPTYKSLSLSLLGPQVLVLVLGPQSPRKLSRTSHSANSPLCMIT